ncbi:MAG: GNAT family N-acetyltransferase [Clostridiales bacterium]|nr:GNAT family N-acetyltransferase [Clostridiales bacterium]
MQWAVGSKMELRFLTHDDIPQAAALWQERFGDSDAFIAWFFENRFLPEHSFGLFEKDELITMAYGTPVSMRMRHTIVPAMLISGVATRVGWERQGLMRRVMETMLDHACEIGCVAALLKPAVQGTYDALGFAACSENKIWQGRAEGEPTLPAVNMWREQAPALLACYQRIMRAYSTSIVRDETAFARKLAENASDDGHIITVGATLGRPSGYALCHMTGDDCQITELVADEAGATAILQHLSARCTGQLTAKLLPTETMPGELQPQNALTIVNVPAALDAILGDNPAAKAAVRSLPIGRLSQILCGFAPLPNFLPAVPCCCMDEY